MVRQIVVSFVSGILVGLCLAFTLSVSIRTVVWTGARHTRMLEIFEKKPMADIKKSLSKAFVVEEGSQTKTEASTNLKQLSQYADRLASSSYTEVEDAYYNRLETGHLKCVPMPHIGRNGSGGWEMCFAPAFKMQKPCLIYSFGVSNIWEFDESLARDNGCTVRAFDPSMSVKDHVHKPGPVNFYNIGLDGFDRNLTNGWRLFTFQSLLKRFGETNRIIDLVKIDIKYSEWETFETMFSTNIFERIKQLIFETHTNDVNNKITSKKDYLRYHKILDKIEALGFRRFFQDKNKSGIAFVRETRSKTADPVFRKSANLQRTCCHNLGYINMRLVESGLQFF